MDHPNQLLNFRTCENKLTGNFPIHGSLIKLWGRYWGKVQKEKLFKKVV